jgi:hypothetical protein
VGLKRDISPFLLLINTILEQMYGILGKLFSLINILFILYCTKIILKLKILLVIRKELLHGPTEYYGGAGKMNGINKLVIKVT